MSNVNKESVIKIKIKEDVKIPGTDIILEKGDVIMCYDKLAEGSPLEFRGQNPANLDSNVAVDYYIKKAQDFFSYTEDKFKYPIEEFSGFIKFDYTKDKYIVFSWGDVFENYYSGEEGVSYLRDPERDIPEWLVDKIDRYNGGYRNLIYIKTYVAIGYFLTVWKLPPEKVIYKFLTEYYVPKEQLKTLKDFNSELPKAVAKLSGKNYLGCGIGSHGFVDDLGYNVFFVSFSDPPLVMLNWKKLIGSDILFDGFDSYCIPFDGRDVNAKTLNIQWSKMYRYCLNDRNR